MSKPVMDKILIANRGEIACRVIQTCRKMGIKTVAIYSTADEQAKHVRMADEAICVGPPASNQSYLRIDAVIDACLKTKTTGVHPGYGFLSENSDFSAQLKKNNIIFIGPDAESIEAMGDKINSKLLAKEANVHTIPGFLGEIKSHDQLLKMSNEIGYPVMVKASGGGGGKGMRVANNDKECVEYFDLCKEEALASFNNDKMLVEKFIVDPRHIEVQVIADRLGNTVYLPERECSIQRRNQKVLEEAPSMFIDPATRKMMGEQAAAMARKVNYVTAGTVEMVVAADKSFYFLEMNTRLQVEHPITELITGVDLVEQMIYAAAGKPLTVKQEDIKINGWATEARVYAEDPLKNFFPSIGRLLQYEEPEGDGVRVDSGIVEGSQISVYYDPLIAKLCTWGKDRNECLARMRLALDEYVIRGLRHNVCLLRDVITQDKYIKGEITTNYLPQTYPDGFKKANITKMEEMRLHTVTAIMHAVRKHNFHSIACGCCGTCNNLIKGTFKTCFMDNRPEQHEIKIEQQQTTLPNVAVFNCSIGEEKGTFEIKWKQDFPVCECHTTGFGVKDHYEAFQFYGTDEVTYQIQYFGSIFDINVMTPLEGSLIGHVAEPSLLKAAKELHAPMPGVIIEIKVQPGDKIVTGSEVLTLEAMKMRNKIRCEVDGTVKEIKVKAGQNVEDDQILIVFE